MTQNEEIGKAMALQLYRLQETQLITAKEACMLLGCGKSTLYKKRLPHNQYGWNKQAVMAELKK